MAHVAVFPLPRAFRLPEGGWQASCHLNEMLKVNILLFPFLTFKRKLLEERLTKRDSVAAVIQALLQTVRRRWESEGSGAGIEVVVRSNHTI